MSSTLILVQQGQASHSPIVAGPIVASPIVASPIVDDNCLIIIILLLTLLAGGGGVPFLAAPVLRALLGCISVLLRVQPGSVWSLPETKRSLTTLLSFTGHSKPKIRKAAQHSVISIVRGSNPELVPHPSAASVASFCCDTVTSSAAGDNCVLYMLTMLKAGMNYLPKIRKNRYMFRAENIWEIEIW